jgi:small subunit ribosomal protein S20
MAALVNIAHVAAPWPDGLKAAVRPFIAPLASIELDETCAPPYALALIWRGKLRWHHIYVIKGLTMANTPQAKKRIRRNDRRAEINGVRVSRIRTFIKKVDSALETGDKPAATAALAAVQPELARGVARGVLHKNTAARKFSRLTKAVAALA